MKKQFYLKNSVQFIAGILLSVSFTAVHAQTNTITGGNAGPYINSGGNYLTLYGFESGNSLTNQSGNCFFGARSGKYTVANDNCFFGHESGMTNSAGRNNAAFGFRTAYNNTGGYNNAFFGFTAGFSNNNGFDNSFFGKEAGYSVSYGYFNSYVGSGAGYYSTTGIGNTMMGYGCGYYNTTGNFNSIFGIGAARNNTTGNNNVMLGHDAGHDNTTASNNVYVGDSAGVYNTTSSYNVVIGSTAGNDYTFKPDSSVFILNNQTNTSNPLLFGYFAGNTNRGSASGVVTYKAQLGINTRRLEKNMTLTLNGRAYIGNFEANGINTGLLTDSSLSNYYLWVEKGIVSEDFAIGNVTDWADYAFKPGYKLMPLAQVSQFIKQYGHLPGMPSEEELKKTGYTMHTMNKRFMLKIEELTMHIIDQNKQLEAQEQQIKELKDALEKYKSLEEDIKQLKAALGK